MFYRCWYFFGEECLGMVNKKTVVIVPKTLRQEKSRLILLESPSNLPSLEPPCRVHTLLQPYFFGLQGLFDNFLCLTHDVVQNRMITIRKSRSIGKKGRERRKQTAKQPSILPTSFPPWSIHVVAQNSHPPTV
jgi:hypothetical protein